MRLVLVRLIASLCAALACLAAFAATAPRGAGARAAESPSILRIDGSDAYVDIGRTAGARAGDPVRVYRSVRVVRPGTAEALTDRFLLGEMQLAEVGEVLSRARPDPQLARQIRLGDTVELASRAPPTEPSGATAQTRGAPAPCPPSADPEAVAFRDAWLAAQPAGPEQRAALWERYLSSHGSGSLAEAIRREIGALRAPRSPSAPAVTPVAEPQVSAPTRAFEGDPLELVLTFPSPAASPAPRAASVNWRVPGSELYHPVRFAAEGSTWRARLPPEAARAPGVDYWVGVVDSTGTERALAGDPRRPRQVDVQRLPGAEPESRWQRSEVEVRADYVDWNHFKGNDYHWAFESDYLYRVGEFVHSLRLGFGVYQGVGQSLKSAIADEQAASGGPVRYHTRPVGYDYAFTEVDLRAAELLGFVVRGLAGVNRDGFGAGVEGKVRIGREPGTNLVLGSGFTSRIGNRNTLTLAWDQVRGWPMSASVIVTNEPVREDYGVRFVYQVGRHVAGWLDLSLRLGYELRDINHSGFGLGLATNFHW